MSEENKQSTIVVVYDGQDTADQVYHTLRDLQHQGKIHIKTAAVVTRMEDGKLNALADNEEIAAAVAEEVIAEDDPDVEISEED